MKTKITYKNGVWTATNGKIKIKTTKVFYKLPVFHLSMDLIKLFPFIQEEILDRILQNHTQQAATSAIYKKFGRCWFSNTNVSKANSYCTIVMGSKEWGFRIEDYLHVVSHIVFKSKDIIYECHHKCGITSCCNPDHLEDTPHNKHMTGHVSTKNSLDEHQLYTFATGKNKITNPFAIAIRDLYENHGFNKKVLAFIFNTTFNTINNVITQKTHKLNNKEYIEIYNSLKNYRSKKSYYKYKDNNKTTIDKQLLLKYRNMKYGDITKMAKKYDVKYKFIINRIQSLKKKGLL